MSDSDLIARVRRGERAAFTELVDIYKGMVFKICLGFVKNREDAEDLAQDVFLSVYQHIETFNPAAKLSTWIYRIAVNRSLNHKRKTRPTTLRLVTRNGSDEFLPDCEPPAPESSSPDHAVLSAERREAVVKALESLPPNQRTALTLSAIEGFSYDDIAAIMECSISAVESRIHRARVLLHKKLMALMKDLE